MRKRRDAALSGTLLPPLPMTRAEMASLGWDAVDVLLVSGDAYVDHPSFGTALLGRWLAAHGFRVGVVAQPAWEGDAADAVAALGRPRLFAGVTAGAIDSMLAHYTAFRKKRHDDAYTPGGKAGARPNRASVVYTGLARRAFPGVPVVLGGIEASLRRVSHYDFWSDSLRRSLLLDSKADLLVYGMGERALLDIARRADRLAAETDGPVRREDLASACRDIRGIAWAASAGKAREWLGEHAGPDTLGQVAAKQDAPGQGEPERRRNTPEQDVSGQGASGPGQNIPGQRQAAPAQAAASPGQDAAGQDAPEQGADARNSVAFQALPSHEAVQADPALLMRATLELERQVHRGGPFMLQEAGDRAVVVTPPAFPLATEEMDLLYSLPFTRLPHPSYTRAIPAWEMIRTSITTHRGCGGGCSFCSLALHQGRRIASRSRESVMEEARRIAAGPPAMAESFAAPGQHVTPGQPITADSSATSGQRGEAGAPGKTPPRWAGSISDVGGPSANMWQAACAFPKGKSCRRSSCMHPDVCPFFKVEQGKGVQLLRDIAGLPGVRHVRVASGVRFDLALREPEALYAYTAEFTGGQLKVAPEHSEDAVLTLMRKPALRVFERFLEAFARLSREARKEQYTVPYLMSAFPGCTGEHMAALSAWLREKRWSPQQVQCFIPTPGTVATAMFFAEITPGGSPLYVAKTDKERLRQHHMLFDAKDGRDKERGPDAKRPRRGASGTGAAPFPERGRRGRNGGTEPDAGQSSRTADRAPGGARQHGGAKQPGGGENKAAGHSSKGGRDPRGRRGRS